MKRHEEAAKLRAEGKKIREIADAMGVHIGTVGSLLSRHRSPEKYLARLRAGQRLRLGSKLNLPALLFENRAETVERNRRVLAMVKAGATYSEAADAQGLSREAVAGLCHRAGIKAPLTPQKVERAVNRRLRTMQSNRAFPPRP